ncbi:MAG: hypothetical protein A3J93_04040 [Candidatus Magasanikbacteria bacterium RIFOXYC2_FULL_42_28]|uniref:Uncharacterized protein n=1 Tax=Candidatus Magasanikbacteria bacterium RIFOXYC2_FULL_42_28 TaxID=1798704 RepID=A0A1F6NW55_9BACT|nr:MAG: hypothetical protein A3J93_04040 [Candidatus Magasanikbacteria bacterium RIFOXYC2_FULL_42_28]
MIRGEGGRPIFEQNQGDNSSVADFDAITIRADLRRRSQELRINSLNIIEPHITPAMRAYHEKISALVKREADGTELVEAGADVATQISVLEQKAVEKAGLFPDLSALLEARAVKLIMASGIDPQPAITKTKKYLADSADTAKTSPASLLPDAIMVGVQKKLVEQKTMPTPEQVAKLALTNKKLLADYALALPESERPEFLALIPDDARREVSIILDENLSGVLRQSIVEKDSADDKQRKDARLRIFNEMKQTLQDSKISDKKLAAALARSFGNLGGDARLLLLELARDEMEEVRLDTDKEQNYLPHIIGVLMKEFDDWRVNDIALQLVGDSRTPAPVVRAIFHKLVKRGYIPNDAGAWWNECDKKYESEIVSVGAPTASGFLGRIFGKTETKPTETVKQKVKFADNKKWQTDCANRLVLLQKIIADLGVLPSRDILEFLDDASRWQNASLDKRVEIIKESQTEFDQANSQCELVAMLAQDERKAMIYYLLHGGDDRFNLINNYSFDKFKEMLKLIADLRVHEQPIKMFETALQKGGLKPEEITALVARLRAGHFPLDKPGQDSQIASFEVSENAAVKNANTEIGQVLGRDQLGVVLLFPMYREYLDQDNSADAQKFIQQMTTAATFAERLALLNEIEKAYPDWQKRAKTDLEENWRALGEKMVLEVSLEQVFSGVAVPVRGDELIPRLDSKRLDLKKMKKDLLVALRGGNEKLDKIRQELRKKIKARDGLMVGLEKQTDPGQRDKLQGKIDSLNQEIKNLEQQKSIATDAKVSERFTHLSKAEKDAEIERIGQEIIAITEKSPSAIFTYLTLQVLGEERLREQDTELITEMESHLQGPFQTIQDYLTYQPTGREQTEKKNQRVNLRWADKQERLMSMVRFADSKICCFSSCNYEMRVQHDTSNKYWVASINADPMSFVISMEVPQGVTPVEGKQLKSTENLGFIFGSFAVDEGGQLGVMLNGIYYAPGIEDSLQVAAIMDKVEAMLVGLPIKTVAIASQHGGSIKLPEGFTSGSVELTRLRALDSGNGRPETKVYDDMGTGSGLNSQRIYNNLWHKEK